jgi:hypothetical protein
VGIAAARVEAGATDAARRRRDQRIAIGSHVLAQDVLLVRGRHVRVE